MRTDEELMDEQDEVLARVRSVLAPLPPANPAAVARILAAVDAERASGPTLTVVRANSRRWRRWLAGAGALAAAAAVAVVTSRSPQPATDAAARTPEVAVGGAVVDETFPAALLPATEGAESMEAVPVLFGFEGDAQSVTLVGDFNNWNVDSMPLERVAGTNRWIARARIVPGRHVYAFVVDGERWVRDPNAPVAPDDDFGKPGSVIMVTPE